MAFYPMTLTLITNRQDSTIARIINTSGCVGDQGKMSYYNVVAVVQEEGLQWAKELFIN